MMGEIRYNGVGDTAVRDAAGKGSYEWFAILEKVGAQGWKHPQIARYLAGEQGAPDWWSQMITVGYEQARGLRAPGQHADGFATSVRRTLAEPLETVYAAWVDEGPRAVAAGCAVEGDQSNAGQVAAHFVGRQCLSG